MQILRTIDALASIREPLVFGLGVFDGVHRGHQAVLMCAKEEARKIGALSGALTFHPHPAFVLRPENVPGILTTPQEKYRLLEYLGIEIVLEVNFTHDFAAQAPEVFIQDLWKATSGGLRGLCMGRGWAFGCKRSGNVSLLTNLGKEFGFSVFEQSPVLFQGSEISSTRIRDFLANGNLPMVSACLGRDFSISGEVQEGARLARTLGFPTANLATEGRQLPPNGVYLVKVREDKHFFQGVANLGVRPTVSGDKVQRLLEVHLFDFSGELYGLELEVEFQQFLRSEQKFTSLESLRHQIAADVEQAKKILLISFREGR